MIRLFTCNKINIKGIKEQENKREKRMRTCVLILRSNGQRSRIEHSTWGTVPAGRTSYCVSYRCSIVYSWLVCTYCTSCYLIIMVKRDCRMRRSECDLVQLYPTMFHIAARLLSSPHRHISVDDVTAVSPPGGAQCTQWSADSQGNYSCHDESKSASASVYPRQHASAGRCSAAKFNVNWLVF